jgi:hypothetical protein
MNQQSQQEVRDTHTVFDSDMVVRGKVEKRKGRKSILFKSDAPMPHQRGCKLSISDRSGFLPGISASATLNCTCHVRWRRSQGFYRRLSRTPEDKAGRKGLPVKPPCTLQDRLFRTPTSEDLTWASPFDTEPQNTTTVLQSHSFLTVAFSFHARLFGTEVNMLYYVM